MKRIQIKIETIAIILLILIVLSGIVYAFTPKLMAAVIRNDQKANQKEAATILQERLITYFPRSEEAREEAFNIGYQIQYGADRFFIAPYFYGRVGNDESAVSPEKAIAYLKSVTDAQSQNLWKANGFLMIGKLYKTTGDYDQAEHWLNQAYLAFVSMNDDMNTAQVSGNLIETYLKTGAYTKAMTVVNREIGKYTKPYELSQFYSWQGDVYYAQGNYQKAKPSYTKAMELEKINWQQLMANQSDAGSDSSASAKLEDQLVYRHAQIVLSRLDSIMENSGQLGSVEGEILATTSPLPNVQVYLINEEEYDGRSNYLEEISAQLPVITDARGKFSFTDIPAGRYLVVLGFVPEDLQGLGKLNGMESFTVKGGESVNLHYTLHPRVNILEPSGKTSFQEGDQIKIAWKGVQDAACYNINLTLKMENGYVSRVYRTGLKGTTYAFAPQGMELREMNFVSWGDPNQQLGPSAILGSFYPGAQIFFQVEAFDQQGRSISDSEGYLMQADGNYPWIEISGTDHISAGDKLVKEKKYTEALKAYKDEAAQDPDNSYALLSLARLYHYGWTEGTANLQQAMTYYGKLLALTDEPFIVEEAAVAADSAGDYPLALQLFNSFEDRMEPGSYYFSRMGELYFLTGNPEKAISYYLKYLDDKDELPDLGPVMAMLYLGDYKAALTLTQEKAYSQKPRYVDDGQVRAADTAIISENLQKYVNGTQSKLSRTEFKSYLMKIMQITGNERSPKVMTFENQVRTERENDVLVQVLLELVRDKY